jgi:hypothetical protein
MQGPTAATIEEAKELHAVWDSAKQQQPQIVVCDDSPCVVTVDLAERETAFRARIIRSFGAMGA